MAHVLVLASLAGLLLAPVHGASSDRTAVTRAATGCATALHQGDPSLVERNVSRGYVGFLYERTDGSDWITWPVRYDSLQAAATRLRDKEDARTSKPESVEVLEQGTCTALVRVVSDDRVSFMQVCREGKDWRVRFELVQAAVNEEEPADPASVRASIEESVGHYVEGFYQSDTERFGRSIQLAVLRLGFSRESRSKPWKAVLQDPQSLRKEVSTWNKGGKLPVEAAHDIEVIDAREGVAAVRLTAPWGKETLLLALHHDGTWRIHFAMWEGA